MRIFDRVPQVSILRPGKPIQSHLILHNRRERIRFEACAADQCAVDLFFADQRGCVVRLDAAAVENADVRRDLRTKQLGYFRANDLVRVNRNLRRGGFAG